MEQPGHSRQDPPQPDKNDTPKSVEGGPLKLEHFDGLTEEQKQDQAIHQALAKFNSRFKGKDHEMVIQQLRSLDTQLTFDDVPKLEQYAFEVENKLNSADEKTDISDKQNAIAEDSEEAPETEPKELTGDFFLETMGMSDLETQAPGFTASLNNHPQIQKIISKIQTLPSEKWKAAINKYKSGLEPIVREAFENFQKHQPKSLYS